LTGFFHRLQFGFQFRLIRIAQDCDDGSVGNQLMQQPQLLGCQVDRGEGHTGNIAAGPNRILSEDHEVSNLGSDRSIP
jgi:hypothetical protein